MSVDEVLDSLLAAYCSECGTELPRRGEQCGQCGALPALTRPEAAEKLAAEPGSAAAREAELLRAEAAELAAQARERLLAADRAVRVAGLELLRDDARDALEAARAEEERAAAALASAGVAEEEAAAELNEASQALRQAAAGQEAARRLRKGPQAEIDAGLRLAEAEKVHERYKDRAGAMTAARLQAEGKLAAATAARAARESALAAAERAVQSPGYIPRSRETITRDLLGQLLSGELSDVDMAMAGVVAMWLFNLTGGEEGIRADERRRIKALEEEQQKHAATYAPGSDGVAVSWATPPGPSSTLPGGRVTPAPQVDPRMGTQLAGLHGAGAASSPGLPGAPAAPPPMIPKAASLTTRPVTDHLWGLTRLAGNL